MPQGLKPLRYRDLERPKPKGLGTQSNGNSKRNGTSKRKGTSTGRGRGNSNSKRRFPSGMTNKGAC